MKTISSSSVPAVVLATSLLLPFFGGALAAAPSDAQQFWPQWRGPLATGVAPEAKPPSTWSETNNIKWVTPIPGEGSSTPVLWGNRIFVEAAVPTATQPESSAPNPQFPPPGSNPQRRGGGGSGGGRGATPTENYRFVVFCIDRTTGKVLWQKTARETVPHEGYMQNEGSFAPCSPVTDGQHVFAYFGSRGLYCYDMDGNLQWTNDFGKMRIFMTFGEGSSPALLGHTLVIPWDNEEGSFLAALDTTDGHQLWKKTREESTAWATPLIVQVGGKPQVVTSASSKIRTYDLATGDLLWECKGLTRNVIPSPVADADTVYCMSGYSGNSVMAIRLGRTGDLSGTDAVVWNYKKSAPYVSSPLLYDGKLYFFKFYDAILTCCDAKTGNVLIDAERIEALNGVYASPIEADGKIYLVGRNGACVVIKATDKIEKLATNMLNDKFDASPIAAGNELFLRGRQKLYCIAEK